MLSIRLFIFFQPSDRQPLLLGSDPNFASNPPPDPLSDGQSRGLITYANIIHRPPRLSAARRGAALALCFTAGFATVRESEGTTCVPAAAGGRLEAGATPRWG